MTEFGQDMGGGEDDASRMDYLFLLVVKQRTVPFGPEGMHSSTTDFKKSGLTSRQRDRIQRSTKPVGATNQILE